MTAVALMAASFAWRRDRVPYLARLPEFRGVQTPLLLNAATGRKSRIWTRQQATDDHCCCRPGGQRWSMVVILLVIPPGATWLDQSALAGPCTELDVRGRYRTRPAGR
jgi:hypothetical protein